MFCRFDRRLDLFLIAHPRGRFPSFANVAQPRFVRMPLPVAADRRCTNGMQHLRPTPDRYFIGPRYELMHMVASGRQ